MCLPSLMKLGPVRRDRLRQYPTVPGLSPRNRATSRVFRRGRSSMTPARIPICGGPFTFFLTAIV